MTKTFLPSVKEVETTRKWHHIDATGQTLGRLATQIAVLLMGKHKKTYTPNMDCGDFVVVTNAGKVKLTGKKLEQKVYFSHSGYSFLKAFKLFLFLSKSIPKHQKSFLFFTSKDKLFFKVTEKGT